MIVTGLDRDGRKRDLKRIDAALARKRWHGGRIELERVLSAAGVTEWTYALKGLSLVIR